MCPPKRGDQERMHKDTERIKAARIWVESEVEGRGSAFCFTLGELEVG